MIPSVQPDPPPSGTAGRAIAGSPGPAATEDIDADTSEAAAPSGPAVASDTIVPPDTAAADVTDDDLERTARWLGNDLRSAQTGPDGAVQVIWGTATDRGRVRKVNEDALLAAPPVFVVSDGMGGHAAGDVAAAIIVEEFGIAIDSDDGTTIGSDWVLGCIRRAGRRIRGGSGGGATVVGAAVTELDGASYWLAFNIGDSRIYRSYDGELTQISVDHSYVQELVEAGELQRDEMRRHPQRNVITRAVGLVGDGDLDCWLIPAQEGERLLLCTDGVTGELSDVEVSGILRAHIDPQLAAGALVAAAVSAGGRDNATALVVDVLTVTGPRADLSTVRHPGGETADVELTRPRDESTGNGSAA
jgi:protein phosphatase